MATNRASLPERRPQIATPGHYGDLEVVRVDVKARKAAFQVRNTGGFPVPETVAPLSMIRPLSEEDTLKFWRMLVDDLMRVLKEEGKLPPFVKGYEVTTGEDSTGDPALYVKIRVSPTRKPASSVTVSRWNEFLNLVQESLMQLRLQRWPYVQLGEWRRRR
jgi:hypothetical protein